MPNQLSSMARFLVVPDKLAEILDEDAAPSRVYDKKRILSFSHSQSSKTGESSNPSSPSDICSRIASVCTAPPTGEGGPATRRLEIDLPHELECAESFEFLGYTPSQADRLWEQYSTLCADPDPYWDGLTPLRRRALAHRLPTASQRLTLAWMTGTSI